MREAIFGLCALTSLVCAWLLIRAFRANRTNLLLWSSVCFSGLFVNNVLLVIDELLTPVGTSLLLYRDLTSFFSIAALLVGLIRDTK